MCRRFRLVFLLLTISTFSRAAKATDYIQQFHPSILRVERSIRDYIHQVVPEYGGIHAESLRSEVYVLVDSLMTAWRGIKPFTKNDTFIDSICSSLQKAKLIVRDEGGELMDLEGLAYKTIEEMVRYLDSKKRITYQLLIVLEEVIATTELFTKKYDAILVLTESQRNVQKMKEFLAVYFNYYDFHTLFFDANVKENYVIMELVAKNSSLLENYNRLLLIAVKKSLVQLNKCNDYLGDTTLKEACLQLLYFYLYEAKEEFPSLIVYIESENRFKTFEANYLAQTRTDRTENETMNYKTLKAEFEKATVDYDIAIERTNLFRTDRLTVWQDAVQDFLVNYLPR